MIGRNNRVSDEEKASSTIVMKKADAEKTVLLFDAYSLRYGHCPTLPIFFISFSLIILKFDQQVNKIVPLNFRAVTNECRSFSS